MIFIIYFGGFLVVVLGLHIAGTNRVNISEVEAWPQDYPHAIYAGYLNITDNGSLFYIMC